MRRSGTLFSVVIVAAGILVAAPPAGAREPAPDPAVAALAAERGVPISEAQRRIDWQQRAPELESALASALGAEAFGGVWIGADDDRIKVGVVGTATAAVNGVVAARKLGDAVDTTPVRHSLNALKQVNTALGAELARVNAGAAWPLEVGYDPSANAVRLGLPPAGGTLTAAQESLVKDARGRFGDLLGTYSYTSRATADGCAFPFCDPPLRAGVQYNPTGCTLAFMGRRRGDNKFVAFTAGHCVAGLTSTVHSSRFADGITFKSLGVTGANLWNSSGDAALIEIDDPNGWQVRNWVNVGASGSNGGVSGTAAKQDYPINGDSESVFGMRICRTGVGSGTSCGKVNGLGVTLTYGGVTVNDLGRATYCRAGGDSGGPVYANNTAFGIHVAGSATCTGYYQGIHNAEDLLGADVSLN
jgi:hypothetical protein